MSEEGLESTENSLIHIGKPIEMDDEWFRVKLRQLDEASYREEGNMKEIVSEIVSTLIGLRNKIVIKRQFKVRQI